MKKFAIKNPLEDSELYMEFYVGNSEASHHPLHFQNIWWERHKRTGFPEIILELADASKKLAIKYQYGIEDVCSIAFKIDRDGKYIAEILQELEDIILRSNLQRSNSNIALWEENLTFDEITLTDFNHTLRRETIGKDLAELSERIITTNSTTAYCARELFKGLMIYLMSFNKVNSGLHDIYDTLEDPRKFVLRLSIMLDSQGTDIHPKGFEYLKDFIEVNHTLIRPTVELLKKSIDLCLPKLQKNDVQVIDFSNDSKIEYISSAKSKMIEDKS
jgi:hypothetical protein